MFDVTFFGEVFSGFVAKGGGGNVADVEFAQIMDETHHEGFADVDVECGGKQSRQQGQSP